MADSEYRTVVKLIKDWIVANAGDTSGWSFHFSEPFTYPFDGPHCAIWFAQEQQTPDGPTGSRNYAERYVVRYWEPAILDEANLVVDDDAMNDMETRYRTLANSLLVASNTRMASGPWRIWFDSGRVLVGGSSEGGFVRGWEFAFIAQRFRAFS